MIKIYGINTCSTVKKAIKFCKDHNLEYEFIDFRKEPLSDQTIDYFASKIPMTTLFNSRGQKYKDLQLKELNLDDAGKLEWLKKENMLLKRPVVQYRQDKVLVSFNEEIYKQELL